MVFRPATGLVRLLLQPVSKAANLVVTRLCLMIRGLSRSLIAAVRSVTLSKDCSNRASQSRQNRKSQMMGCSPVSSRWSDSSSTRTPRNSEEKNHVKLILSLLSFSVGQRHRYFKRSSKRKTLRKRPIFTRLKTRRQVPST